MSANFQELLSVQVDSVEPPKLFPAGPYDAVVLGHELGESSQKGTPYVRFQCKLLSPREGVDPEEFEAAGGMEKLADRKPLNYDQYLTPDAMFRLRQFMENALQIEGSGRTFDQTLPETKNVQFIAVIGHERGQREGEVFMRITDAAAAE